MTSLYLETIVRLTLPSGHSNRRDAVPENTFIGVPFVLTWKRMRGLVHGAGSCEREHFLQLYSRDFEPVAGNVARYLAEGLTAGEPAVIIAIPENARAIIHHLEKQGCDASEAMRTGRLSALDGEETLAGIVRRGWPAWSAFEDIIDRQFARLRKHMNAGRARFFGEMVGLLWNDGRSAAAGRLEQFWNRRLAAGDFSLFCAYQIDVLGSEFQLGAANQVLCAHSSVISGFDDYFTRALHRAATEMLGTPAGNMELDVRLPAAEAAILWLRNRHPDYVDEVLARALAASAARRADARPA